MARFLVADVPNLRKMSWPAVQQALGLTGKRNAPAIYNLAREGMEDSVRYMGRKGKEIQIAAPKRLAPFRERCDRGALRLAEFVEIAESQLATAGPGVKLSRDDVRIIGA